MGYDYVLGHHLSVGAEFAYLGVVGPDTPDTLSLNGLIKYWYWF